MFTRNTLAMLSVVVVSFVNGGTVRADTWAAPTPAIFGTDEGGVACKILPAGRQLRMGQTSMAELFRFDRNGKEVVMRRFVLVNIPCNVMVVNDGEFLVTINTFGKMGFERSVVVYNAAGKLVRDLALEDFFSERDVEAVPRSVSSRHWTADANIRLDLLGESLLIDSPTGTKLAVQLKTGRVFKRR